MGKGRLPPPGTETQGHGITASGPRRHDVGDEGPARSSELLQRRRGFTLSCGRRRCHPQGFLHRGADKGAPRQMNGEKQLGSSGDTKMLGGIETPGVGLGQSYYHDYDSGFI